MGFLKDWKERRAVKNTAKGRHQMLQQATGLYVLRDALERVSPSYNFPGPDDVERLKRIMTDFPIGGSEAVRYYFANPSRPRMSFIFYLVAVVDKCIEGLTFSQEELDQIVLGNLSNFTKEEMAAALDMPLATALNCIYIRLCLKTLF